MGEIAMIMTDHGKQRIKDRVGLSKKLADKIAEKALTRGIRHSEVAGSLRKMLDALYLRHKTANNIRIYNQKVYLFDRQVLITVIDLPSKFFKVIEKINKNKAINE